jgi:hypothetical protein
MDQAADEHIGIDLMLLSVELDLEITAFWGDGEHVLEPWISLRKVDPSATEGTDSSKPSPALDRVTSAFAAQI